MIRMKSSKILSAVSAALIAAVQLGSVSAYSATAGGEESLSDGTFTYEMLDNGYKIVSCTKSAIITEIPSMRNGYAIVEIGDNALMGCTYINEITIPKSVKKIGAYSFAGCTGLRKAVLPDSLTEIQEGAFDGCSNMTELTIGDSVSAIGDFAFANCPLLEDLELPETLTTIGKNAFESCGSIKELNLPASLEEIGNMAFVNCYSIEKITADNNKFFTAEGNVLYDKAKTRIYRAAAHNIDETFYVPDTVTMIEDGAFSYCTELSSLIFTDNSKATQIGQAAFFFCTALSDVEFPKGLVEIQSSAFANCTAIKSLSFPVSLQKIGEGAFFNASSLEKVIIPEGLVNVEAGAFSVCDSLKNIIVPKSVESIGEYAFGYTVNDNGDDYKKLDGFTMSVNSGSAALKYAKKSDIEYTVMDKSLKTVAFAIVGVGAILAVLVIAVFIMRRGRKLAPADVRKAEALEAEENDPSYESIIDNDDK